MKRVGMVSVGAMGSYHASCWKQLPVDLVGYYDRDIARAEAVARELGGTAFASLEALLAEVDIVDVCTPTYEHASSVIAAAAAGKDIVCEKPLARHLAEAEAMIAACTAAGVRLFVAQVVRFFPEFARAKAVVESGAIGTPGVIRTVRGGNFPRPDSWYGDFEKSGGVILDLSIHDIDYVRWLCGDITRVFARGMSFSQVPATDHALLTLRFASGAIGHIEGSWAYPAGEFRTSLEIAGNDGLLNHDSRTSSPMTITLKRDATAEEGTLTIPGGFSGPTDDPYYRELKHFIECLDSGADFLVSAQDAFAAMKVALAAIESQRSGQVVDIATFEETT